MRWVDVMPAGNAAHEHDRARQREAHARREGHVVLHAHRQGAAVRGQRARRQAVRPVPLDLRGRPRLFLVAQVPRGRSWRRSTTLTARRLDAVLRPLLAPEEPAP